ncbi:MAG: M48 family metallopeptidase [Limisphaerales bacterium]
MSGKTYNVVAWNDDEESISGEMTFGDHAVHFVAEGYVVDLQYSDLELDIRGGKSPKVTLSNPDSTDWSLESEGHAVLADRALRGRTSVRRQIEDFEDQKDGFKRLLITFAFFAGFIGLSAVVGIAVEAAMPKMVALVPISVEKEMTEEQIGLVREMIPEDYAETNAMHQLYGLLDRVCPKSKRGGYEFELSLIDSPEVNAFAMPGGKIFVFTGILEQADSTEEIAGVLAHEAAHVMKRHSLRHVIANAGPSLLFDRVLGSEEGFLSAVAAGSSFLVQMNFSRSYEREADDIAFDYLVDAGIDPRGLEQFLQKLLLSQGDLSAFNTVMSHPPSAERVEAMKKRWRDLKKKPAFEKLPEFEWDAPERKTMGLEDMLEKVMEDL